MKIYLAIKYHADHANRSRIEGITTALQSLGHETVCVTRDLELWGALSFKPDVLMARSFDAIDRCDLLVAELTEKGVGVGIEAGYAHAKGIPIMTIARAGMPISATLRGISTAVIAYTGYEDLLENLACSLSDPSLSAL